jgi:hypothetical protein
LSKQDLLKFVEDKGDAEMLSEMFTPRAATVKDLEMSQGQVNEANALTLQMRSTQPVNFSKSKPHAI